MTNIPTIILSVLTTMILTIAASCTHSDTHQQAEQSHRIGAYYSKGFSYLMANELDSCEKYAHLLLEFPENDRASAEAEAYGYLLLSYAYSQTGLPQFNYPFLMDEELRYFGTHASDSLVKAYSRFYQNGHKSPQLSDSSINKAYEYSLKAYAKADDDHNGMSIKTIALINLMDACLYVSDKSGVDYAKECYDIGNTTNSPLIKYLSAVNLSYFNLLDNNAEEAKRWLEVAEELLPQMDYPEIKSRCYQVGAQIATKDDMPELAETYLKKAITNINDTISNTGVESALNDIKGLLPANGKPYPLLKFRQDFMNDYHNKLQSNIPDSLSSARNIVFAVDSLRKELLLSKISYNLERQESQLNAQHIELMKKRQIVVFLSIICAIALTSVILIILFHRHKTRLYKAIVSQASMYAKEEQRLQTEIRSLQGGKETASSKELTLFEERLDKLRERFEELMMQPEVYSDKQLSLEKVADLLGTNRTYVSRIVKETYGTSFPQLVNNIRIKEAVRILSNPDDDTPLKALSDKLGFNSISTFYSTFRKHIGISPGAFRDNAWG